MMLELIDIVEWCDSCSDAVADKLLINTEGTILGWYCDPCGELELERAKEYRRLKALSQRSARCHFNENSNRQCMLDDYHTGGHNLPCIESSAHGPHAKSGADADGNLYQCSGHRFDYT